MILQKGKIILLIFVIIFSIFFILIPRFYHFKIGQNIIYKYPLHIDEWQDYYLSQSLDNNYLNPSISYYSFDYPIKDGSIFFHWVINLFQKIGINLSNFYYLIIFQIIFFIFCFFLLLNELFDSKYLIFLPILFSIFLKSNVRILGLVFLKPFNLGLSLFFLSLYFLYKKEKINIGFLISSFLLFLTYPPFLLPLIIFFLFLNKNKNFLPIFIFTFIFSLLSLIIFKNNINFLFEKIIYHNYWTGTKDINLVNYFGIPFLVLSVLGFIRSFKYKKIIPFTFLFLFFIFNFLFMICTGYALGFHYVRNVYIGGILMSIYAGLGVYEIIKIFKNNFLKLIFTIFIILILCFPVLGFYKNKKNPLNPSVNDNWLEKENLEVLNYLKNNLDNNLKLLHPEGLGTTIYGMTNFKITALSSAVTGGKENKYHNIINNNCDEIKKINEKEKYDLFLLEKEKKCSFLKEKFNNNKYFIYEYIFD